MKTDLVRFGVAMERQLLERLDGLVRERKVTRSEVLRDLVRAEVVRSQVTGATAAVATLTLVYDHHVRELTERLMGDGIEPVGGMPAAFAALIAKEIGEWRELAGSAKITLD